MTFDPHPNLRDLIDGWHAVHPEFPLTPAPSSLRTSASAVPVDAVAPCAQTRSETGSVYIPSAQTEGRWRQGATRLGISFEDYRRHKMRGEKWCSWHRDWHPTEAFRRAQRQTFCRSAWRAYLHERYRQSKKAAS